MSQFDQILARHLEKTGASSGRNPMDGLNDLYTAHAARVAEKAAEKQAELDRYSKTMVGREGFRPESTAGAVRNSINSGLNAISRGLGQAAASPFNAASQVASNGVDDDLRSAHYRLTPHREDYDRIRELQARRDGTSRRGLIGSEAHELSQLESSMSSWGVTSEELARLNERRRDRVMVSDALSPDEISALPPHLQAQLPTEERELSGTYLEQLDRAATLTNVASGIRDITDATEYVDNRNKEGFQNETYSGSADDLAELSRAWYNEENEEVRDRVVTVAASLGNLFMNAVDAGVRNPAGFLQTVGDEVAESLAGVVAAGGVGLVATNAGYSFESYQKGIDKYQAENNGELPDRETRHQMAEDSALMFILNLGADGMLLSTLSKAASAIPRVNGLTGAVGQAAAAPAKLAGTSAVQGATEIGATYFEGQAELNPASAQDLYYAAVVGAGMGATAGAPGAVREETAAMVSMVRELAAKAGIGVNAETAQAEAKTFAEAIADGDTSPYTDRTSDHYSPTAAMSVLFGNTFKEDTTDEQKRDNRSQANEVMAQAALDRDAAQSDWDAVNPEGNEQRQRVVDQLTEQLETATPEEAVQIASDLALYQSMLDEAQGMKGKEIRARKRAFEKAQAEWESALKLKDSLDKEIPYTPEDVESILASVRAPADEAIGQQAAASVINLAMEQPDLFSPEQLTELVSNEGNTLTPIQREYLRAFSASKDAENQLKSMGQVTQDILEGGQGYKGLPEYRAGIAKAIRYGSTQVAQAQLEQLESFGSSHEQKAALTQQANDQAMATGQPVQVVRTKEGTWTLTQGVKDYRKGGGLQLDGDDKGARLAVTIATESAAINTAITEAHAMMALGTVSTAANDAVAPVTPITTTTVEPTPDVTPREATQPVVDSIAEPISEPVVTEEVANVEASTATTTENTDISSPTEIAPVEPVPSTEPTDTAEAVPAAEEYGGLKVLQQSNNEVTQQSNNPVSRYFKQTGAQGDGAARKPLVAQKDFLSTIRKDAKALKSFIKNPITDQQKVTLNSLVRNARQWTPTLQKSVPKPGDVDYMYKDILQGLANEDGTYDENVITAMAVAGFRWVAETGTGTQYNNKEAMNAILGRPKSEPVDWEVEKKLATIGTRRNVLINSLGRTVAQGLGLSAKDANTPADQVSRMHSALGAHVYSLLKQEGLVQETVMSAKEMAKLRGDEGDVGGEVHIFSRATGSTNLEPVNPNATAIIEASRKNEGILEKLFGIDDEGAQASFEPVPFKQANPQKSETTVPSVQDRILKKHNKKENVLRTDGMAKVMEALPREALRAIAGFVDTTQTFVHPNNQRSVDAKNRGIERELDAYYDFVEIVDGKSTDRKLPFFLQHAVWVQQRVGMMSRSINMQASKIHRHLVQMQGWEQKDVSIDPANPDFIQFQLAVADSLGVKTDGLSRMDALTEMNDKLNSDLMRQALITLRKINNDIKVEDAEVELLVDAIQKEGGEKFHTLDGLMGYAAYLDAADEGKGTFTHSLTREIDGKTNGPMLTQLLTGAASSVRAMQEMVEKGGFFSREGGPTQVNAWASESGNNDLYQSVAKAVNDAAQMDVAQNPEQFAALFGLSARLVDDEGNVTPKGRKVTKTPVTQVNFGSSITNTVKSMGAEFADNVLKQVEEIVNKHREKGTDPNPDLQEVSTHIKTLTGITLTPKQLVSEIPNKVGHALQQKYVLLMKEPIKAGIESHYADFLRTRDEINGAGKLAFGLYDAIRQQEHAKLVAAQTERDGKGNVKHDLSPAQEKTLRQRLSHMEPIVHTAMSKLSNELSSGFSLIKRKQALSNQAQYLTEAHFGESGWLTQDQRTGYLKKAKSVKVRGMATQLQDRGVGALVLLVHAFDSAISSLSYEDHAALNVHDANIVAAMDTLAQARRLNENTFKLLMGYSIPTEMANTLARTLEGFVMEVEKDPTNPELRAAYAAVVKDAKKSMEDRDYVVARAMGLDPVGYQLFKLMTTAKKADITKLQAMRQWTAVDQYSMEGGNYVPNDDDRTEIDRLLEERQLDDPESRLVAAKHLATLMKSKPAAGTATPAADVSSFGTQGKATAPADAELTVFLAERGKVSAKLLMTYLKKSINAMTPFQDTLLAELSKRVGNVTVQYVTPGMSVPEGTKERAAGWFHQDQNGKQTIFIRSPDFTASRIDPELMLHELVHAATANTMAEARKNPGANPELTDIMNDLEALRTQVENHLKGDTERLYRFAPALTNIDELVAWGMTNEGFQAVLNEVKVKPRDQNSLVEGMRAFVKSLVGLVFPTNAKSKDVLESGLTRLISNGAAIMGAEATTRQEINLAQESVDPLDMVMSWTTEQVFDALERSTDDTSEAHRTHLRNLMGAMVTRLHGPFGAFKVQAQKSQALTPDEVFIKAIQENKAPFASDTLAAGFKLSQQESFVLEQVEASVAASLDSSNTSYKELAKVYQEARKALRNNPALTADQYAFLFTMTNGAGGKSAHLSRFAALALTYEPLNQVMNTIKPQEAGVADNASLGARVQAWFNQLLAFINQRITGTYNGQPAGDKIHTLADNLVHIEAKRRMRLANQRSNPFDFIENGLRKVAGKGRESLDKIGNSKFFKESKSGYVRTTGKMLSTIAKDRMGEVIDAGQILRDRHYKRRQGMIAAIISEMTGADDKTKTLFMLNRMTKNIERTRIEVATQTGAQVLGSFNNKGTNLTKKEKNTLTAALLRTDLSSLLDHYSMYDIHEILLSQTRLNQERAKLEKAVGALPMGKLYTRQANDLGRFMATGENFNAMLQQNAHNIAHLYGLPEAKQVTPNQETIDLIDQLVSLNALSHTNTKDIKALVAKEKVRGNESGIEFTLRMAKHQKEQSQEKLFNGSPVLMVKGYTKEITDPYKTAVAAPAASEAVMREKGYSVSPDLFQDPTDPSEVMKLYVIDDGGLKRHLSGAMSLTGERAKGTTLHGGMVAQASDAVNQSRKVMTDTMTRQKQNVYAAGSSQKGHMVPVFNEQGEPVNYRYMMTHAVRDDVLGRNNALDAIMGGLEGELLDKVASPEHNHKVVEALRELYKADYHNRPDSYLTISDKSDDPKLREIYRMMPRKTKEAVREVWGRDEMLVRADVLDLVFGYRKFSAADALDKAREERNVIENAWVAVLEGLFKGQAGIKVRKTEDIAQTIVKHVKDIVVIKNVKTLLGNVASNTTQLLWHGVNPVALAKDHKVATESAIAYRRDKRELDELERRQAMGYTTAGEVTIAQRIPELKDALARNPSTPLIEAGMMPTIVEDIDLIQDPYSYQSKTATKLEKWTEKVPKSLRNVGKQVYMTHDTTMYKVLSQGTQLSDYVARYTLYQHVRNRDIDPMTHEDALHFVMEAFINYDVPTHRNLQYMNDMGFVFFTKYYLRIQRVILALYRDQPARALALIAFNGFFDLMPTLMDSQMTERLGNPLSEGALRYPDVLDQLATVRLATEIMR